MFVYSTKLIRDQDLQEFFDLFLEDPIAKFSITNAELSDTGIVLLCTFFQCKKDPDLRVLKLYSNILSFILQRQEASYLLQGTKALAECF